MKKLILVLALSGYLFATSDAQETLKADYYNGIDFEEYVGSNYVSNIDFYWNQEPPISGLDPNKCSAIYTGQLKAARTGNITFSARVDDGIQVWIDDQLIISNWQLNDVGYSKGDIELEEDKVYKLKIHYFNALNEAELRLKWKLPENPNNSRLYNWWFGTNPEVIPAEYFLPPLEEDIVEVPEPVVKPKPKRTSKPTPKKKKVREIPTEPVEDVAKNYIPKNIEFEQAKSEILPVSFPDLDKLARYLTEHPEQKLKIEGHTDNVGDRQKNLLLSEKRAKAIAAYLVKKGVHYTQITSAIGYGGSRPIAQSDGRKYHPENRRVEFIME